MEKKITKIILPLVIIVALIGLLIAAIILIKLSGNTSENETNCTILSADNSQNGTTYICSNSSSTYIYNKKAIYDKTSNNKLIDVEDFACMAATDNELYYCTPVAYGELYRYSFTTQSTEPLLKETNIDGIKANKEDVFVVVCEEESTGNKAEDYKYDLLTIGTDKEIVNLNDWAEKNEPVWSDENYVTYEYNGYKLTADKTLSKDKVQFAYVEKEDDNFSYSCLPYNVYAKIGKDIVCIEKYPEEIAVTDDGKGGISPLMTGVHDGCFYSVVQYSRGHWAYDENPSVDFKVKDTYYKYDPQKDKWSLLYEAENGEQIAGFSVEKNVIYLLRKSGVYEHDLKTEKEKLIVENTLSDEEQGELYFENFEGELYIFSENYMSNIIENIK